MRELNKETSTKVDGPDNPKTEVEQHDPYYRVMSPTPVGITPSKYTK